MTAGCSTRVKVHRALAEPWQFPEVMGRLSTCRKCACLLPGPSVSFLGFPSSFPKALLDFEQEADFSHVLPQVHTGTHAPMC